MDALLANNSTEARRRYLDMTTNIRDFKNNYLRLSFDKRSKSGADEYISKKGKRQKWIARKIMKSRKRQREREKKGTTGMNLKAMEFD